MPIDLSLQVLKPWVQVSQGKHANGNWFRHTRPRCIVSPPEQIGFNLRAVTLRKETRQFERSNMKQPVSAYLLFWSKHTPRQAEIYTFTGNFFQRCLSVRRRLKKVSSHAPLSLRFVFIYTITVSQTSDRSTDGEEVELGETRSWWTIRGALTALWNEQRLRLEYEH